MRELLQPLANQLRFSISKIDLDPHQGGDGPLWGWTVELRCNTRARKVGNALVLGRRVAALLRAAATGQLTRESARDLVLGGQADSLVGQVESSWLEVKSTDYDLSTLHGRYRSPRPLQALQTLRTAGLSLWDCVRR